jgi:hypothetical protein
VQLNTAEIAACTFSIYFGCWTSSISLHELSRFCCIAVHEETLDDEMILLGLSVVFTLLQWVHSSALHPYYLNGNLLVCFMVIVIQVDSAEMFSTG